MNTQILHCQIATSNDDATVYSTEERLTLADLETIVDNAFPISIILTGGMPGFALKSPIEVGLTSDPVGARLVVTRVLPDNTSPEVLSAMLGSVIMNTHSSVTGLDPDIVYLMTD